MRRTNLAEKLKIIEMSGQGRSRKDIAQIFNVSVSSVREIVRNKETYKEYDKVIANKLTKKVMPSVIKKDLSALELVKNSMENNIPITGRSIIQQVSSKENRKLSKGWFNKFKKRNLLQRIVLEQSDIKVRQSERSLFTQGEILEPTVLISTLEVLNPLPNFIEHRLKLWNIFKEQYETKLAAKKSVEIIVQAKNKNKKIRKLKLNSWKTTPFQVAGLVGRQPWCDKLIVAKVDGFLWDLQRPLERDCFIEFLTYEDDEGKKVLWNSSALILGQAIEKLYGCQLCDKAIPPESGFFYDVVMIKKFENDFDTGLNKISKNQFPFIESSMKTIVNENQLFERLELTKEQLLELFSYNRFKVRVLEKIQESKISVYRCGTVIDLCSGPHVRHTGLAREIKITQSSLFYNENETNGEPFERVYGISFPNRKLLKEWQDSSEELFKQEHFYQKKSIQHSLFFSNETYSPGSYFFTPQGTHIYNTLLKFIKSEYKKRKIKEVITPNIFNMKLYDTSGHSRYCKDSMIQLELKNEKFALKQMSCLAHCLIFNSTSRSLSDLPIKLADFDVLHQNASKETETSVKRFQQDEAHIFCTPSQISNEIRDALDFINKVYTLLDISFEFSLSTRPEAYIGEIEQWDFAEKVLKVALDLSNFSWKVNLGGGAFSGPKIDIIINNTSRESFHSGSIQLDFQTPIQFSLKYSHEDGVRRRPAILHFSILGPIERFISFLAENFAGKWPFWLSPNQAIILLDNSLPISFQYAQKVQHCLDEAGFAVELDTELSSTIDKKIRKAQFTRFNFLLIIGSEQVAHNTVYVRSCDNKIYGDFTIDFLLEKFKKIKKNRTLNVYEEFFQ